MTTVTRRWLARLVFAGMVVAATYPAWRLLELQAAPTADEALQLLCGSRSAAGVNGERSSDALAQPRRAR